MLELLFLLLPIAALYGYIMGARSSQKNTEHNSASVLWHMLKSLDVFASKEQSKASEAFMEMMATKAERTFEENITLGTMYRERGELDKAIKMHKASLETPGITAVQRSCLLLELAKDFQRSGLLNKSEEILHELIGYNVERKQAVKLLIHVYEQEREWTKAIDLLRAHRAELGNTLHPLVAQFYCELANEEFSLQNYAKASDLFKKALSFNGHCFRAYQSLAKISVEEQKFPLAIEYIKKAAECDNEMIGLLVRPLRKCFTSQTDPQYLEILHQLLEKNSSIRVVQEVAVIIFETKGKDEAEEFLLRILKRTPNVAIFAQLLNYRLSELDSKSQERLSVLQSLIEIHQIKNPKYICHKCGFKSGVLFWQCPSCHAWEQMKPTDNPKSQINLN